MPSYTMFKHRLFKNDSTILCSQEHGEIGRVQLYYLDILVYLMRLYGYNKEYRQIGRAHV